MFSANKRTDDLEHQVKNSKCWKFRCTTVTEAECFARRLFGDSDQAAAEVSEGDTLFLHNTHFSTIYGPFVAETDAGLHESKAWRHLSRYDPSETPFRYQVRVGWNHSVHRVRPDFATLSLEIDGGFQRLPQDEAERLLEIMDHEGKVVIMT